MTRLRALLVACAVFYALFIVRSLFTIDGSLYATLFDDAMISMRYARNLADGHGLVWNAGGPAVQGFTNPLWTLLMAGVHAAGVPPRLAALPVMLIGALLLLFTTAQAFRLAHVFTDDEAVAVGAAALTGFAYGLVFWTLRGMEVGLLAALITWAVVRSLAFANQPSGRDLAVVAAALIAAMWTRSDALVPSAILAAYLVWAAPAGWRGATLGACAVFLVVGLAVPLVWSRVYFGHALPNTYYLKLAGVPLVSRIARGLSALVTLFARGMAAAVPPAVALLVAIRRDSSPRRAAYLLLAALVAGQCAYSVYVGGDAWEWMGYANRYVAIVLPALAVLSAAGVRRLVRTRSAAARASVVFVCLIALHAATVWFLLRGNRGIDISAVDVYRAHRGLMVAGLAAAAIVTSAISAAAFARRSFAGVCAVIWLLTSGVPAARWAAGNAFALPEDQRAVRMGLVLREALAPQATFAVSWAGAIPYFADHAAVDLLGKTDPVIARLPPAIPEFVPGHNKWNLRYSIGQLKPDLACNLPRRPGDVEYLIAEGYHRVGWTCFVRQGGRVDEARLTAGLRAVYGPELPAPQRETR